MKNSPWPVPILNDGILSEPTLEENRLALWLPGKNEPSIQHWERIATVARAEVSEWEGIHAIAAMSWPARQPHLGMFRRLWHRWRRRTMDEVWTLPTGEAVEPCGPRQTGLLLVWSADAANPLDERRIREQWPQVKRVQALGPNLFLVDGVASATPNPAPASVPQGNPRERAERLIAAARQSGDRRWEMTALTDLGILCLRDGDIQRALAVLEESVALAHQLGDRTAEHDAQGQLGLALLHVGQIPRAQELFEGELSYARERRDVFAEKAALFHLGLAGAHRGQPLQALALFDQALQLARQVGDRQQEADLLWHQAILYAAMGQREQALVKGQAAVTALQQAGKPQAGWFAEHLQKYRQGLASAQLGAAGKPEAAAPAMFGGTIVASAWTAAPAPQPGATQPAAGPGLLRMAFTAGKAMAKFVASGGKRVTAETHAKRVQTCQSCEHHTGLRCRLCGCFTGTKAWMAYEDCPIGKWPR